MSRTSLDVHFRNTLMELCKKDNWELYTLKKLWLKLEELPNVNVSPDAALDGRGSVCKSVLTPNYTGGSHVTIFCPLIRPLRRVAIDGVARPRRHLVGCSPFEGLLSAVVVWTGHHRWIQQSVHFPCGRDQKEQVNSIDAISPGVPLSDLVTTADQQDTKNPRIVEAEDRVSELLLGRPQAISLMKLTLSETLQQVSQGCALEPSRWEPDKGSLEWNPWRAPELEMLAESGQQMETAELESPVVFTGIGRCSDWSRDLVASGKSYHGAEITLFISDLVANHVRRDVVIKLRLEGIIQEYSEATSGGKMT
uniref:(California timema) hypothetical protein n=1 Tax=Timema californicum TaxID=61474 RepID=A0A7R9J0C1_TIMCA|nr:unnamed protein product [Timema californicum]